MEVGCLDKNMLNRYPTVGEVLYSLIAFVIDL